MIDPRPSGVRSRFSQASPGSSTECARTRPVARTPSARRRILPSQGSASSAFPERRPRRRDTSSHGSSSDKWAPPRMDGMAWAQGTAPKWGKWSIWRKNPPSRWIFPFLRRWVFLGVVRERHVRHICPAQYSWEPCSHSFTEAQKQRPIFSIYKARPRGSVEPMNSMLNARHCVVSKVERHLRVLQPTLPSRLPRPK